MFSIEESGGEIDRCLGLTNRIDWSNKPLFFMNCNYSNVFHKHIEVQKKELEFYSETFTMSLSKTEALNADYV